MRQSGKCTFLKKISQFIVIVLYFFFRPIYLQINCIQVAKMNQFQQRLKFLQIDIHIMLLELLIPSMALRLQMILPWYWYVLVLVA